MGFPVGVLLLKAKMGAYKYMTELYRKKQSDVMRYLLRVRCWQYRQLTKVHRAPRSTRPDKARHNEKIEAKVDPQPNGELENGVNSSEKESTDLRSTSPVSAKRSLDEVAALEATPEQPSAKKLKTCEENATAEAVGVASEAAAATPATTTPAAATTTPQVAV